MFTGSRPTLNVEESEIFVENNSMSSGYNAAEEQFKNLTQERREVCQLRNKYTDLMGPVWDSFERNCKIRVDLEVDSDGELVLDEDGRPNDLTGNDHFDSKSEILSFFEFFS